MAYIYVRPILITKRKGDRNEEGNGSFIGPVDGARGFAACSKNSVHTVTFDSSGGTQIKTQHILDGESAKKPWDPHKEGFTFIEW